MKKFTAVLLVILMVISLSVDAFAAGGQPVPMTGDSITTVAITGFVEPVLGAKPITKDNLSVPSGAGYHIGAMYWCEKAADADPNDVGVDMTTTTFQSGKAYYASIQVEPDEGNTIADETPCTINGYDSDIYSVIYGNNAIIITIDYIFEAVAKLATPTNVQVALDNATGYPRITNNTVEGATHYPVYRSTSATGEFEYIGGSTDGSKLDTGAEANTTYYYKVSAKKSDDAATESLQSAAVSITVGKLNLAAPTGVNATYNADIGIRITWNGSTNATGYDILRKANLSDSWAQINTSAVTGTSYTDSTSLQPGNYYYAVRALDSSNTYNSSVASSYASVKVPARLATPVNVKVELDPVKGYPKITNDPVEGADIYPVYRSTSATGEYEYIGGSADGSKLDTTAEAYTTYYYKVSAKKSNDNDSESPQSSAVSVTVGQFALDAPTGVSATRDAETGKITVKWTASANADGYDVMRSTDPNGSWAKINSATVTGTSFTDSTELAPGNYYYTVMALDSTDEYGPSPLSNYASVKVPKPVLSAPADITTSNNPTTGKPYLTWPAVENADTYDITRSTSQSGSYTAAGSVNEGSFTDTSASAGTTYYYKIAAKDSNGNYDISDYSTAVSVKCLFATPTGVTASTNSSGKPYITWTSVSGANQYVIYRSTQADDGFEYYATVSTTSFTDTDAAQDTTYYYKLYATKNGSDGYGSAWSAIVSANVPKNKLSAPASASATYNGTTGKPVVSWGAVANADGYELYRATSSGGEYTLAYTADAETRSYTDESAAAGTTYYYKVKAVDSTGSYTDSDFSSVVSTPCRYAKPTGVEITINAANKPVITWTAVDGANQYSICRSETSGSNYSGIGYASGTTYTDTTAKADTTYYYKLYAFKSGTDGFGSDFSAEVEIYVPKPTLPTPANVAASYNGTTGKPYLTWSAVADADQYNVYRAATEDGEYALVGENVAETSFTDANAVAGNTYYYKLTADASSGDFLTSAESAVVSAKCRFAKPTNVAVKLDESTGDPQITWAAVEGADLYVIARSSTQTGTYTEIGTSTTTNYTDESAAAGASSFYKVYATKSGLDGYGSDYSAAVSVDVPKPILPAPTNVAASYNGDSGKPYLTWTAVSGADQYLVYRATTETGSYTLINTINATSYTDTSATAGNTYYYMLKANDSEAYYDTSAESAVVNTKCRYAKPADVTAELDGTTDQPLITWTAVSGANQYVVARSTALNGTYEEIGTVGTNSYNDSTAERNTTYFYKLYATNTGKDGYGSDYSEVVTVSVPKAKIAAPTNVAASYNGTSGKPYMTWTAVEGASQYTIYRSTAEDGTYTRVSSVNATNYTDTSATAGTTYYYKLTATPTSNELDTSLYSAIVSTNCRYAKPTDVSATNESGTGKPVLTWSTVSGADIYYIYRATAALSTSLTYTQVGTSSTNKYTDGEASFNSTYYYKIYASKSGTDGYGSDFTTPIEIYVTNPNLATLSAPSGVSASYNSTTGKPLITWNTVTGADQYNIYRSTSQNGEYTLAGIMTTGRFSDTSVLAGATYYYKVISYSSKGEYNRSAYSSVVSSKCRYAKPTSVTVTLDGSSKPYLTWAEVSRANQYCIYRSTTESGTYTMIGTASTNSYTDTSAAAKTTYYYKLYATNTGTDGYGSDYSAVVSIDVPASSAVTLSAPTNVAASYEGATGKPYLTWTAVTNATQYSIYRSTTQDGTYTIIDTVSGTSYTDTSATQGTTYFYKLTASATTGNYNSSGYSSVVNTKCRYAKPTNVSAVIDSDTGSPYISWSAVLGADQYCVYRATSSAGTYTYIGTSSSITYTDTSAQPGTTYYYKVYAARSGSDGFGSDFSSVVSVTVPTSGVTSLAAPTNVAASYNGTSGKPYLTWTAVSRANQYTVYRSTSQYTSYSSVGTTTSTSYTDSSATPGTTYYYYLTATSTSSNITSDESSVVSTKCRYAKPSNVRVSNNTSGKPVISWSAVNSADSYAVYRATSSGGTYSYLATSTATSYTDTSAAGGTTYYYKLYAFKSGTDGYGSDFSAVVSVTAGGSSTATLTTPENAAATYNGASGKPYITWSAVSGADSYTIYRSTSSGGTFTSVGTSTTASYTDTSAAAGTTYYYKVTASASTGGTSDYSATVSTKCRYGKPSGVAASYNGTTGKPYLTWSAVSGADSYVIYRAASSSGTYAYVGIASSTSYTDTSAAAGTTYYYKIYAYKSGTDGYGSDFSSVVSAKCRYGKPSGVAASYNGTTGKPYLTWSAVADADSYVIYRATIQTGTYSYVGIASTNNYTDTSASAGTTYYYKIYAYKSGTDGYGSDFSSVVTAKCRYAKPSNISASTNSAGKPTLTWTAVTGADQYIVFRATSSGGTYSYLATATTNSFTDSTAASGTTYYYKVYTSKSGTDGYGSDFSSVVSATAR